MPVAYLISYSQTYYSIADTFEEFRRLAPSNPVTVTFSLHVTFAVAVALAFDI